MNKPLQCYKMTFEAIDQVRRELAQYAMDGNDIKAMECLTRLSDLYTSIDAKRFIECMVELENKENVRKVNFKNKKTA